MDRIYTIYFSVYTFKSDGKGGRVLVKKAGKGITKPGRTGTMKKGKGFKTRRGGGPDGNMSDFR